MAKAYLLARLTPELISPTVNQIRCTDLAVFSEPSPTMMGKRGFWAVVMEAGGEREDFEDARREVEESLRLTVPWLFAEYVRFCEIADRALRPTPEPKRGPKKP